MATQEPIEAYDLNGSQKFEHYMARLQDYFSRHQITDDKKQTALFLSVVGSQTHTLLKKLLAPVPVHTKDLRYISGVLNKHFEQMPTQMGQRMKFYESRQLQHETVSQYHTRLTWLARKCDFSDFTEQAVRDKFVCGLKSSTIKRRLVSMEDLTLRKAVETAQKLEEEEEEREDSEREEYESAPEILKLKNFTKRAPEVKDELRQAEDIDENVVLLVHKVDTYHEPYKVTLKFPDAPVEFDVASGTGLTVISKNTYKNIFGKKFQWKEN